MRGGGGKQPRRLARVVEACKLAPALNDLASNDAGAASPSPRSADRLDHDILLPALALAAVMVLTCGWVSVGLPLARLVFAFWVCSPVLIAALLWWRGGLRFDRTSLLLALAAITVTWIVLADVAGRLAPTELISYHPDAWSYQTMADFFLHNVRGRGAQGLPIVDQFGSTLQNTRFGSATALALLTRAPGLSVAQAHLAFYALCIVVHFFSFSYLMRALAAPWSVAAGGAALGTAGGWLSSAVIVGNYDNLLFVALFPALLGLMVRFEQGAIRPGNFVVAGGVLMAALGEVYPEGSALLGVLALPLAGGIIMRCWSGRQRAIWLVAMLVLALLLASPYLPTVISFLRMQIGSGTATNLTLRPGSGVFPGLLGAHWFPAIFALGEELPNATFSGINLIMPAVLSLCVGVGVFTLWKNHRWFPWTGLCLLALSLWQGARAHYDYGFYKVLFCGGWWIYSAAAFGLWRLIRRASAYAPVGPALITLFAVGLAVEKREDATSRTWQADYSLRPIRELVGINQVIGNAPILIDVDNDFEMLWASFFLRTHALSFMKLQSYYGMPHIHITGLLRPQDCRYVLRSGARPGALWQNDRFSVLPNKGVELVKIENPQGVESLNKRLFFWVGTKDATLTVFAMHEGEYDLRMSQLMLGPSFPTNNVSRRVEVGDAAGRREVVVARSALPAGPLPVIPVKLRDGLNTLTLRDLDPPISPPAAAADKRDLLLGIGGVNLAPHDALTQ